MTEIGEIFLESLNLLLDDSRSSILWNQYNDGTAHQRTNSHCGVRKACLEDSRTSYCPGDRYSFTADKDPKPLLKRFRFIWDSTNDRSVIIFNMTTSAAVEVNEIILKRFRLLLVLSVCLNNI